MSEQVPPAARPASQLTSAPTTPPVADALRAMGPDYEEALVAAIAARVDELAQKREPRATALAPPGPPAPYQPPVQPSQEDSGGSPRVPITILSLIFGTVLTVIALTAGLAISGPIALLGILIVWIALVMINGVVWRRS